MKVARFDPSGKNIFAGTASGNLLIFNTRTKIVSLYLYVSIINLQFSSDGCSSQNSWSRVNERPRFYKIGQVSNGC